MTAGMHYNGRRFSFADLELMRQAAEDYAALGVTEIARTVCEWLDWKRPNGRLKNHECRLLLQKKGRETGELMAAQSSVVYHAACRSTRRFATLGDPMPEARS